jgi:hypothetical protein
VSDEDVRLAHYAAEQRAREALVRVPSPQPVPETHEEAIVSAHEGRPTVAVQDKQNGAGLPAVDKGSMP